MAFIGEKGRIFGIINVLDLAILSFIVIFITALFLYSKFPLQLKEHRDVIFQMYFEGGYASGVPYIDKVPYAIGQQVFVPGTELIATYEKRDKAVITSVKEVTDGLGNINFLVTINASLEVDAEGDYLFNGNDVAPGNPHNVQVGTSYLWGKIWRVDYEHHTETINVTVTFVEEYRHVPSKDDLIFDLSGNNIGKVIERTRENFIDISGTENQQYFLTLSITSDAYDGEYFVSELPLKQSTQFYFIADKHRYKGFIVGVSP